MTNNENLYGYVFWYNPYENLWYAIERNSYLVFFNGNREKAIYYKSKDINTLSEILTKDDVLNKLKES
jgi:hypothetical protein